MTDTQITKKLVGLESEVNVLKVEEEIIGNRKCKVIYVANSRTRVRCPYCNKFTRKIHDRLKPIKVKYVKMAEYTTYLKVYKRRFNCPNCNKRFTEDNYINSGGCSLSNKLIQKVLKDLKEYNLTLKYIATNNNISDNKVRQILKDYMKNYPKALKRLPSVISLDEFKADTQKGKYALIINDILHKTALDVLPTRKKEDLIQYFTHIENRSSVQYVISDMYEPYLLVTTIMFPKAKYVVDRFHYIRYVMNALDDVRKRLQEEFGYKSKEYKLLKNKKNVSLLRKYGNEIEWWVEITRYKNGHNVKILPGEVLRELLNLDEDLRSAYNLKEMFLDIVNHATHKEAERQILSWIELVRESQIEEMNEAADTIENWLEQICNSFIDKRFSNGYTEGLNNKIKVIKRVGFGYKNFEFFRLRLMYILRNKNNEKMKKSKKQKSKNIQNAKK